MAIAGQSLRDLYIRLLKGWNDRDAKTMAKCFATEGIMIGFDGSVAVGREAIEAHLAPIFADHPTAAFVTIVRSARVAGELGLVRADVGMVPPGQSAINARTNARQVMVVRGAGDQWEIELFQNTPAALHQDEAGRAKLTEELDAALRERGHFPT